MHDSEERYPPPLCHEGTREVVICRIEGWYGFEIPPEKKIMWVHAPAGYGKTAVAGTVSKKMESRTDLDFNPVGATFFFWRTSPERNSPARFIITLAYQFTISIPELAPHIEAAVKRNPMVLNKALEVQLTKLIVEPFKSLGELDDMPHRLVIIDGLDECINSDQQSRVEKQYAEDQERVQVRVLELIRTLHSHNLPLCFLILSRSEPWIKGHIESRSFQPITETLDLYQVGDHLEDVEKFVRDELARIAERLDAQPGDDEEWPGEDTVRDFLQRTGGHMLYAATVIRHIDDPYDDPRQRLQDILESRFNSSPHLAHSTPFSSLHELYRQILRSCPQANRPVMVGVLEEILMVRYYWSGSGFKAHSAINILDRLCGRAPGRGIKALRPLHALICLSGNDDRSSSDSPFFYHSSFAEFLEGQSQLLPDVTINVQKGVSRLLAGCLKALSAITMDGQVCEEHVQFSLDFWSLLWRRWDPIADADPSSHFKALLATDLTACFVQNVMDRGTRLYTGLRFCLSNLYRPNHNLIVRGEPFPVCITPLVEDLLSHLRSSVEACFRHVLDPECFTRHGTNFDMLFHGYMIRISVHRPVPAFDNLVQALRGLLEKRADLFKSLEESIKVEVEDLDYLADTKCAVMDTLKLVRQDAK
uniref:Nephrocystin 3-like N-terminal domain-containing protein n=1 Tax=Candolleomyces aberdarensis TaxID=2316362 RepID=A0A4Q2D2Z6_9AGAR